MIQIPMNDNDRHRNRIRIHAVGAVKSVFTIRYNVYTHTAAPNEGKYLKLAAHPCIENGCYIYIRRGCSPRDIFSLLFSAQNRKR